MKQKQLEYLISPGGCLQGEVSVPGDKSISHRSIMMGSIATGDTVVEGFLEGEDSLATLEAFRQMGVSIEGPDRGRVLIHGVGLHGLKAPSKALNLGNSGTSMRLMSGLLAAQPFDSILIGDESLSRRPMKRITQPLTEMGARIQTSAQGTAPITIQGGAKLHGIHYRLPTASAQIKSCILFAGLYAEGQTCVTEPAPTRDHTERMLNGFGWNVDVNNACACLNGGESLSGRTIQVPGDISSAAFFLVGASIAPNSNLLLTNVGMNPTRTGVIDILQLMGAKIEIRNERVVGGESVADLRVRSSRLKGIAIPEQKVPLAIDEFPAIFIAAACAEGVTTLTGAEELRVKESDRIQVMADALQEFGIEAIPTNDGIRIVGGTIRGGTVDSHGDHRIAMAGAMAGLVASESIKILDCANVQTSFPDFIQTASVAGLDIRVP